MADFERFDDFSLKMVNKNTMPDELLKKIIKEHSISSDWVLQAIRKTRTHNPEVIRAALGKINEEIKELKNDSVNPTQVIINDPNVEQNILTSTPNKAPQEVKRLNDEIQEGLAAKEDHTMQNEPEAQEDNTMQNEPEAQEDNTMQNEPEAEENSVVTPKPKPKPKPKPGSGDEGARRTANIMYDNAGNEIGATVLGSGAGVMLHGQLHEYLGSLKDIMGTQAQTQELREEVVETAMKVIKAYDYHEDVADYFENLHEKMIDKMDIRDESIEKGLEVKAEARQDAVEEQEEELSESIKPISPFSTKPHPDR